MSENAGLLFGKNTGDKYWKEMEGGSKHSSLLTLLYFLNWEIVSWVCSLCKNVLNCAFRICTFFKIYFQ